MYFDDSDTDPAFTPGKSELIKCIKEVIAASSNCLILLCCDHFIQSSAVGTEKIPTSVPKPTDGVEENHDIEDQMSKKRNSESFDVEDSLLQSSPKTNEKDKSKQKRKRCKTTGK